MSFAQEVNAYLSETEPWKTAKSDRPVGASEEA